MRGSKSTAEAGKSPGHFDWLVADDVELEHIRVSETPAPCWNPL
jgi:hypothetical protein